MARNFNYVPEMWDTATGFPWGNNYPEKVKLLLKEYTTLQECQTVCEIIDALMKEEGWTSCEVYPYEVWA